MPSTKKRLLPLLALASACHAGILYDNIYPADAYWPSSARPTYQNTAEIASRFTITQTSLMTGFEAVLEPLDSVPCCSPLGNPRTFTVTVYEGNAGIGAALGSVTVSQVLGSTWPVPITTVSFPDLLLTPGAYYIGISNPGIDMGWYLSTHSGLLAYSVLRVDTGVWDTVPADRFYTTRILGDPVPEPATASLFAFALAAAATLYHRRR
ncbi:MAG: hypothetical protein JST93_15195 [Acidobacteria bacterium]|nr:hypothetical protein [Acidobacteriota bacterium]